VYKRQIYGTSKESTVINISTYRSMIHPDDRERDLREQEEVLKNRNDYTTEFRIVRPSGEVRHIRSSAVLIRDTDGNPVRVTGINTDITEMKNAEERMSKLTLCMLGFGSNKDQNINCLVSLSG